MRINLKGMPIDGEKPTNKLREVMNLLRCLRGQSSVKLSTNNTFRPLIRMRMRDNIHQSDKAMTSL